MLNIAYTIISTVMSRSSRKGRRSGYHRYYLVAALSIIIAIVIYLSIPSITDYIARENVARLLASRPDCSSLPKKALIADSLSIDYPNEVLINRISELLRRAGYSVDIKRGADVTPELYSRLNQYSIVVLRIHGGKADVIVDGRDIKINGLFTGLEWRDEYMGFKLNGTGTRAYPYNSTKAYLAVLPKFFYEELEGLFCRGSVVIVASCYSLYTRDIADTLGSKGLSYYIGFEGLVSVNYIDNALERLLDLVFTKNLTWVEAVEEVLRELGPDPTMGEYMMIINYRS
ncbi:MAG: hypothetical protein QXE01_03515 [Sulfolobales archaeon]